MNNASQTCQDESGLLKVLNMEDKKNEKFDSTVVLLDIYDNTFYLYFTFYLYY